MFHVINAYCNLFVGRQEEILENGPADTAVIAPTGESKIRTLQDLFRPPVDITFKGTFEVVRVNVCCSYFEEFIEFIYLWCCGLVD